MNASNAYALTAPVIPPHPLSPHDGWLTAFPRRTFLELGAYDTAAASARGHARNVLAEWRLGELEEAVLAVVTELVANSVAATAGIAWETEMPPVRLWLLGGAAGVIIAVWDVAPEAPEPRLADVWDEGGRGLGIVSYFSAQWDYYRPPAPAGGKVTRALITRPASTRGLTAVTVRSRKSRRLSWLRRLLPLTAQCRLPPVPHSIQKTHETHRPL